MSSSKWIGGRRLASAGEFVKSPFIFPLDSLGLFLKWFYSLTSIYWMMTWPNHFLQWLCIQEKKQTNLYKPTMIEKYKYLTKNKSRGKLIFCIPETNIFMIQLYFNLKKENAWINMRTPQNHLSMVYTSTCITVTIVLCVMTGH